MAADKVIADGLYDWINSLRVTSDHVQSLEDFSNGTVVWKVLQQIHPKTFAGDLPHSPEYNNVAVNKANLTHCYAKVVDFLLSVECGQDEELLPIAPDLQEIAQSDSLTDLIRLLKHLPLAAFKNKTRKTHYLQDVIELASSTQGVMMNILSESGLDLPADTEESEGLDKSDDSSSVSDIDAGDLGRAGSLARANNPHSELEKEERFAKVLAENERITQEKRYAQKQLHTLHDKHVALQQNHDATQDQLNDTKDRLDALLAGTGRVNASRNVDSKHDALIADMEQKTSELEQDNESLRRELAILSVKAEKSQRLQDECDVLKDENGKLVRKAATADKYKQKIEASQGFQKENEALKVKVVELQKQVKESDSTSAATSELRRENQEYRDILSTIEQDRNEQSEMRKRTELEYHTLRAQHEELSKQSARQQAGIEELQGRLQDHEEDSPTTPKLTTDGLPLTYYDPQFLEDEAKISEGLTTLDIEEQNYISEAELRAIMTAMQAQARNSGTSNKASDIAEDKKLAEKLERGRHTTKQLIQHTRKQSALIANLRGQLSSALVSPDQNNDPTTPSPSPSVATSTQQITAPFEQEQLDEALRVNQNLRRELQLMASAWYDQNRRLTNGNVSVLRSRPAPEPRGFLGRQRKAVEDVMIGKT